MAVSIGCKRHLGNSQPVLKAAHALVVLILVIEMQELATMGLTDTNLSLPPKRNLSNSEDEKSSFKIHLIHPHHVDSPYMLSNLTLSQRIEHSMASSMERWNYLADRLNGNGSSIGMEHKLSIPISAHEGAYLMQITPGTQPQSRTLWALFDTGSDLTWVRCQKEGEQSDIAFNQAGSSSYVPISYDSQTCQALHTKEKSSSTPPTCIYIYEYVEKVYTKGELVLETVSFPNSKSSDANHIKQMVIGCALAIHEAFNDISGVVGMGRGSLSLVSQSEEEVFSYCLVDFYSARTVTNPLVIGSFGDILLQYTPLVKPKNAHISLHHIHLKGISVDDKPIDIPRDVFEVGNNNQQDVIDLMVDTGVTMAKLYQRLYRPFFNAIYHSSSSPPRISGHQKTLYKFDLCYDIEGKDHPKYPRVVFHFEDKLDLDLSGSNTFLEVVRGKVSCLAFRSVPTKLSILGNVQLQNIQVGVSLTHMGFAPHRCVGHVSNE